jgi:hypothetical protein
MTPEFLKQFCKEYGSQALVAKRLGINLAHFNQVCNGKRPLTKPMECQIILMQLGIEATKKAFTPTPDNT